MHERESTLFNWQLGRMPENSAIHHEQELLAQISLKDCGRRASSNMEPMEDGELKDIGELLGFRITGGRDFFMPITIFHVNIVRTPEKSLIVIVFKSIIKVIRNINRRAHQTINYWNLSASKVKPNSIAILYTMKRLNNLKYLNGNLRILETWKSWVADYV